MDNTAIDYAQVEERMAGNEEPAILLTGTLQPSSAPPHIRSRLGGLPNPPAGTAWPRTRRRRPTWARTRSGGFSLPSLRKGFPLHFLAQIDCAELPMVDPDLPERGLLLFFARIDEEMVWDDDANDDVFRVIYVADPASAPDSVDVPRDTPAIGSYFWGHDTDSSPGEDETAQKSFPCSPPVAHVIKSWPMSRAFRWHFPEPGKGSPTQDAYILRQQRARLA